jgi:tripartite-type tricarboxylate transporter receptor subunit TctC
MHFKTKSSRRVLLSALGLAAALAAGGVQAQAAWPAQPIKIIVPYPAGGNADAIARLISGKIAANLGQSLVIENKAGAGGTIGTQQAARSPGDGYTFLMTPNAVVNLTPLLRKVPYDPATDLLPVAMMSSSYGLVAARKDLPANTMAEFIALAKKEPGKLTFGSVGPGTATHINGEIVHLKAGIKLTHVPYKGSSESLADLLGGRIDVIYDPVALAQIKAGNLKALAVTSPERHPELPAVPTLREQKLEVPGGSWFGVFAPRGTPPAIIARMDAEVAKAVNAPDSRALMAKFSQYPDYKGAEAFARDIREDTAFFKDLIAQTGLKIE